MKMQKAALLLMFVWIGMISCSTKVELYTDFKDVTIVYGVMDVAQDTNFIKITRAFSGSNDGSFDAYQFTQIADSLNYPGKLDARLIELKNVHGNYAPTGREIILDTITIHNKQEGLFYAPDQKMYYTKEHFKVNNENEKYRYQLSVRKANDTVTSEIGLLGSTNFQIHSDMVYFRSKNNAKTRKLYFSPDDNDAIYQIKMQFNYKELHPMQDTVNKNVVLDLGSFSMVDLGYEDGLYFVTYHENDLFRVLATAIGDDTIYAERFFDSFVISIAAYGKELHHYALTNQPTSVIDYSYTNIKGGRGVLSSRYRIGKDVKLSSLTQTDLLSMPWGFQHLGY